MPDEVTSAAPSVGAAPETSVSSEGSLPTAEIDGDILSAIQSASASRSSSESEEPEVLETDEWGTVRDSVLDALAESPTATDEGEEAASDATPPAPAPAPTTPGEPTAEELASIARKALKASNLDPALKEPLADAYYRANFYKENGYTPQVVKQLKESGVTPDNIIERISLHGTLADAQRDAYLASFGREIVRDLRDNPSGMLDRLKASVPEDRYGSFLTSAFQTLERDAPQLIDSRVAQRMWNIFDSIEATAQKDGDADVLAMVAGLRDKVFEGGAAAAAKSREVDPRDARLRQLEEENQRRAQEQRGGFETALRTEGGRIVADLCKKAVEAAAPKGVGNKVLDRIVRDVFEGVGNQLFSNERFVYDLQEFLHGPLTNEQFQRAVAFGVERAKPLIPMHVKNAVELWTEPIQAAAASQPPPKPQAPKRPDVGGTGGPPAPAPSFASSLMREKAARGLSVLDTIKLASAARSRQR